MKRTPLIVALFILSIGLVACSASEKGVETEELKVGKVDISDEEEEEENTNEEFEVKGVNTKDDEEDEEELEVIKEYNVTIVNDDEFAIQLQNVERIEDVKFVDDQIKVNFQVKNKLDDTIALRAEEVSIDGKMVEPSQTRMNTEVGSGKKADSTLTITNNDGDLPELKEEIEVLLNITNQNNYADQEELYVHIDLTSGTYY